MRVGGVIRGIMACARAEAATQWSSRAELVGQQIGIALRVWIIFYLYRAVGVDDLASTVWIVAMTQAIGVVTHRDAGRIIGDDVRSGDVAYRLVLPLSYVWRQFAALLGFSAALMPVAMLAAGIPAIFLVGWPSIQPVNCLAFVVVALHGLVLHFMCSALIGIASFITEDNSALRWIYQKAWIALGGMIIPVALLPGWLGDVARLSPFPYLFSGAAEVLAGGSLDRVIEILLTQLLWIVGLSAIVGVLFRAGMKRLVVQGG